MNPNESSKVTFTNEEWRAPVGSVKQQRSGITQMLIQYSGGRIKNEQQATYILIAFIVVSCVITLFLFFGDSDSPVEKNIDPLTGQEILPGQVPGGI